MFYFQAVLGRQGPLAKIWAAAHTESRLTKAQILSTNIEDNVEAILEPKIQLSLRINAHLLFGIVRIYSRQVNYTLQDATHLAFLVQAPNSRGKLASSGQGATPGRKSVKKSNQAHQLSGIGEAPLDAITLANPELVDPLFGLEFQAYEQCVGERRSSLLNHDRITLHEDPTRLADVLGNERGVGDQSLRDEFYRSGANGLYTDFLDFAANQPFDDGFGGGVDNAIAAAAAVMTSLNDPDGPPLGADDFAFSRHADEASFVLESITSSELAAVASAKSSTAKKRRKRVSFKGLDQATKISSHQLRAQMDSSSDIVAPTIDFAPVTRHHMMMSKYGTCAELLKRPGKSIAGLRLSALFEKTIKKLTTASNQLGRALDVDAKEARKRHSLDASIQEAQTGRGGAAGDESAAISEVGRNQSSKRSHDPVIDDLSIAGKRLRVSNMAPDDIEMPSPILPLDEDYLPPQDQSSIMPSSARKSLLKNDSLMSPSTGSVSLEVSVNSLREDLLKKLSRKRAVTFYQVSMGMARKEAAKCFWNLLLLHREGYLKLGQQMAYGEIAIQGCPLLTTKFVEI